MTEVGAVPAAEMRKEAGHPRLPCLGDECGFESHMPDHLFYLEGGNKTMFEIVLNGMVYAFEEERMAEIMDMLDAAADEVHEE